jgi:hypothetical protein
VLTDSELGQSATISVRGYLPRYTTAVISRFLLLAVLSGCLSDSSLAQASSSSNLSDLPIRIRSLAIVEAVAASPLCGVRM